MKDHLSDSELIALCLEADSLSYGFNLIVRKYQERLYHHIRKMVLIHEDADDILQQTFIKVWKGLDNFREDSQLFTWMYRIATNECLNFLKSKNKNINISIEHIEHELKQDIYFDGDKMELIFQAALQTLPEKQRLVFNMRYYDDLKYEEISEILETSVGGLKASYHHAKEKIKKFIELH